MKLLALLLTVFSGSAFAAGAAFLQQSDYLAESQERTLTAAQAKFLADKRKDSVRANVVTLNVAALDSGVITIVLKGVTYEFVGQKDNPPPFPEYRPGSDKPVAMHTIRTWAGKGPNLGDRATLTVENGLVYGHIVADRTGYSITHAGDGKQVLSEIIPREKGINEPPYKDEEKTDAGIGAKVGIAAGGGQTNLLGDPTVNILTVVSPGAVTASGLSATTLVGNQINELNAAFVTSNARLNVASVGVYVATVAGPAYDTMGIAATLNLPNYPVMKTRDDAGADVVMFIIRSCTGSGCSLVGKAGGIFPTDAADAKAVVELDGLGFPEYVYEHEFGHLLGARHQRSSLYVNPSTTDVPYNYGHGYGDSHAEFAGDTCDPCFHTIMSGNRIGQCARGPVPEITWHGYSNPAITFMGACGPYPSVPAGAALANNAAVLTNTAATAATWRNQKLSQRLAARIILPILSIVLD